MIDNIGNVSYECYLDDDCLLNYYIKQEHLLNCLVSIKKYVFYLKLYIYFSIIPTVKKNMSKSLLITSVTTVHGFDNQQ